MKRQVLKLACAAIVLTWAASTAPADVKIKTKNTTGSVSTQSTTWVKGARLRTSQGVGLDTIDQCDLNRTLVVNEKGKRYMVQPMTSQASPDATPQKSDPQQATTNPGPEKGRRPGKHGVTTYTTTIVDTGERKQIFGFTARHLKLTTAAESSPDACNPVKMKTEYDGWYIDLDANPTCTQGISPDQPPQASKSDCGDEVRYQTTGDGKLGFPVLQTVMTIGQEGRPQTMTIEVVELSQETLDAKLFDIPPDYKQVNSYSEVAGLTLTSPGEAPMDPSNVLEQLGLDPGSASGVPATVEPKKTAAIRIGVAAPENKSDRKFFSPGLRDKLIAAVGGGNVEAIPLRAHSQADAELEAKKYDCDYLLFTDIETLKKSTPGGMLGKVTKMAGANPLNDKYEAKVDYRLYAAGNPSPVAANSESAKSGGGVSVTGVLQLGMTVSQMMMPMMMMSRMGAGMPPGMMSNLLLSRLQGAGQSMLMQQLMGGMQMMGGTGGRGSLFGGFGPGGFGPGGSGAGLLDKKEEALLVQTFGQEAKSVVETVQKRQQ